MRKERKAAYDRSRAARFQRGRRVGTLHAARPPELAGPAAKASREVMKTRHALALRRQREEHWSFIPIARGFLTEARIRPLRF
jgi:hypothetical protein